MGYVDVMVTAVPTANKQAYIDHVQIAAAVLKDSGALTYLENWGNDVPEGKVTDFHRAVQATPEETVTVAWVTWPDKATRDAGWQKVMQDSRMANISMPFDGKRMIYGGFETVLSA